MERFVKRNMIIEAEESAKQKRLRRRAPLKYGLPDPVERYGFGEPVQRRTTSPTPTTAKSSPKTSSTSLKVTTSTSVKTTSSSLKSNSVSYSSSSSRSSFSTRLTTSAAPTTTSTSTQGVFHAVATNIAYDSQVYVLHSKLMVVFISRRDGKSTANHECGLRHWIIRSLDLHDRVHELRLKIQFIQPISVVDVRSKFDEF
jgi:hypothetical protein